MKNILKTSALIFAVYLLSGCTEDREIKSLLKPKDQIFEKAQIDQESQYLYTPMGLESSRTSLYGRAFEVGTSRVVKFQINEFALDVVAIEKDARFSNNPNNQKLLISIPIEHLDYRCEDDAYGECVGSETENERINWKQKRFIKPDFAKAKVIDTNFFAYEFAGQGSCYSEEKVEVLSRSLDLNSLNFTLKRDYKDQLYFFCIRNHDLSDFNNLNWTETTSYSLVKLDTVASKDYKKAVYNRDWISTFGFFETDDYQLDIDGNTNQSGEIKYIQRWNPSRTEINYYLSESFNEPKNLILKKATYESFKRINDGLAAAEVNFRLKLNEPSADISAGDLRNSMIILVDDPVASSVIGYGPSIVNPLTGEVISARTIMYSGSINKFVGFTYDEIVRAQKKSQLSNQAKVNPTSPTSMKSQSSVFSQKSQLNQADMNFMVRLSNLKETEQVHQVDRTPEISNDELQNFINNEARRDFIEVMAKQNKYPAEALDFGDISQDLVEEVVGSIGELKPWEELSSIDKQRVLDILTPYVWVPTLVHEVGHNLGLRHNFGGSEDKENFYSNEELSALGVPVSTKNVPYSSVMDYPKSEVNALRTLGKYDIAALKFGYKSEVKMEDGSVVAVDASIAPIDGLKNYSFCSDEAIAPNANCNPFDEGTNIKEIAQSMIDSYYDRYESSNFRKGRANFSGMDDDFYLRRINRTFGNLRLIYERYESLVKNFQLDQETIDSVPWIKEYDEAVVLAADFMMDVIASPDLTCIVFDTVNKNLQPAPIGDFSDLAHERTRRCQDLQLNPRFVVVGEAGKNINSVKLPSNPNIYADQIDIRGVWIDKVLAMKTLFKRTLGSTLFDKTNGNFLDHPKAGPKVRSFISDIMTNRLIRPIEITDYESGEINKVNFRIDFDADYYQIPASELPIASRMLGLPYENMYLQEALFKVLSQSVSEGSDSPSKQMMEKGLKVYTSHPDPSSNMYISTEAGGRQLFVNKNNGLVAGLVLSANRADFYENSGLSLSELAALLDKIENFNASLNLPVDPPTHGLQLGPVGNPNYVESKPFEMDEKNDSSKKSIEIPEGLSDAEKQVVEAGLGSLEVYLENPTSSTYLKRILLSLVK